MIYFISFGSNAGYEDLSYRIVSLLSRCYPGSFYKVFTPADLPTQFNAYAKAYRRGYGYWLWKPWIIWRTLRTLQPNDILVYVDGRTGLAEGVKSVTWLDEFIANEQSDLAVWQLRFPEENWTKGDLLARFEGRAGANLRDTGQFAATFHAWRVNQRSVRLASGWCDFMVRNPALCRDDPSRLPNAPNFSENRHDQSVLSLMIKVLMAQDKIRVNVLNGRRVTSDTLLPQKENHPRKKTA